MTSEFEPSAPSRGGSEVPRRSFGHYHPIAVLGHGGMGTVYLAASHGPANFTKLVVVKELQPELADDPEFRTMFLDEARLAARLHHPNIVHTFEVVDEGNQLFIVMEYLDGQPFSRVRQRLDAMDQKVRCSLVRMLADSLVGLHHAHELTDYSGARLNVVHRDVSPQNLFVTYAGEAKVVDFGVAKVADASARSRAGVVRGKLTYMAPEQAQGIPVDRRADIFAAGVMLWEIAAGRRMWKGLEDIILGRLNVGNIPSLRGECPEAPDAMVRIVDRAVAARREDRYPTAAAFQADLEEYLSGVAGAPSSRRVGALISEVFATERAAMRGLIEEQMRQLLTPDGLQNSLPLIDERGGTGSTAVAGPPVVTASQAWNKSTSLSQRVARSGLPPGTFIVRRKALAVFAAACVMTTAATLVGWSLSRRPLVVTVPPAPVSQSSAFAALPVPSPSVASPPAAPGSATLRLSVTPSKATIFLDDAPLDGNPIERSVAIDHTSHRVRASAPGFVPHSQPVVFNGDHTVHIILQAAPRPSNPRPPSRPGEPDLGF